MKIFHFKKAKVRAFSRAPGAHFTFTMSYYYLHYCLFFIYVLLYFTFYATRGKVLLKFYAYYFHFSLCFYFYFLFRYSIIAQFH